MGGRNTKESKYKGPGFPLSGVLYNHLHLSQMNINACGWTGQVRSDSALHLPCTRGNSYTRVPAGGELCPRVCLFGKFRSSTARSHVPAASRLPGSSRLLQAQGKPEKCSDAALSHFRARSQGCPLSDILQAKQCLDLQTRGQYRFTSSILLVGFTGFLLAAKSPGGEAILWLQSDPPPNPRSSQAARRGIGDIPTQNLRAGVPVQSLWPCEPHPLLR